MVETEGKFGLLQVGIVVLTLITAIVHLTRNFPDITFILNGLGYLSLLAALYFLPLPILRERRGLIRYVFMGFTALTIFLWIIFGERSFVGYATKIVELALFALLFVESRMRSPNVVRKDQLGS
ncbi:MAG TPA: hypothetical protein VMT46_10045 [Anaerolineaceae bacterium]|nr:hypothetical protein [Anaerolineaceae bacterium]